MTHDELVKQYFMNPNTTDITNEANRLDDIIHHKIITDINYQPKTLEEAKQHPLWVEGHTRLVHRSHKILICFLSIFSILTFFTAQGTYHDYFYALIAMWAINILPMAVTLYCTRREPTGNKSRVSLFILLVLSWVISSYIGDIAIGQYTDSTSWYIIYGLIHIIVLIIVFIPPILFDYRRYKFNYMIKYE